MLVLVSESNCIVPGGRINASTTANWTSLESKYKRNAKGISIKLKYEIINLHPTATVKDVFSCIHHRAEYKNDKSMSEHV